MQPSSAAAQPGLEARPQGGIFEKPRVRMLVLGSATMIFLTYCLAIALTRAPWFDEGVDANAPYSWITTGYPGVSVLDDWGSPSPLPLLRIAEHNYIVMPLHMVYTAAWFKIFGFGLLSMRISTVLCGLAALLAWYYVVKRLTADSAVAVVTFTLIALDYGYVLRSSEGRMDALSAAFGFGGLAAYLYFRQKNFTRAVVLSHACVAASAFTHPNGGMMAFAGLAFLTLYYDWRQIRVRHIAIALVPYLMAPWVGVCTLRRISKPSKRNSRQMPNSADA